MHFSFAGQEVLVKQHVPVSWPKRLTVNIKQKMEKLATSVNHVFLLMKEHR